MKNGSTQVVYERTNHHETFRVRYTSAAYNTDTGSCWPGRWRRTARGDTDTSHDPLDSAERNPKQEPIDLLLN